MNVNLRGAFVCLRECARAMRDSGGAIVAITSVSGFLADRTMAHYAASKAGLAQLVRSAARELGEYGDSRQRDRTGNHRDADVRAD